MCLTWKKEKRKHMVWSQTNRGRTVHQVNSSFPEGDNSGTITELNSNALTKVKSASKLNSLTSRYYHAQWSAQ